MTKKSEQQRIEELLRRQGVTQRSSVEALVSEVRSDYVPVFPPSLPPLPDGILGGIVVIWQFCLTLEDVPGFHDFLRKTENFVGAALLKSAPGVNYRGTYMVLAGGEECCRPAAVGSCYRVIWSYESLDALGKAWDAVAKKEKKSNLYDMVVQLRSYWLRDPQRSEVRIAPAVSFFDPDKDAGDGFAKLTLDAAELSGRSEQTASGRRVRAGARPKKK
jgi:hypothetical protein